MEVPPAGDTGFLISSNTVIDTFNDINTGQNLPAQDNNVFEAMYLDIRKKEKRLYKDAQVELLPLIYSGHLHYKEWQVRKRSANRLLNYLKKKSRPLSILEVGCGNGWLSAKMAALPSSKVTGIDINKTELEQARRVFRKKNNLEFFDIDLRQNSRIDEKKFDIIVFAASIQYFHSLEDIISRALSFLKEYGEIHILDSHFYKVLEVEKARMRSKEYYKSLGHAAMSNNYFHHGIDSLKYFSHRILFDPAVLKNKIFRKRDAFPWIVITNK